MSGVPIYWSKPLVLAVALLFGWMLQGSALAIERSDILLDIVTHCVNPAPANYCGLCRAPRNDAGCGAGMECRKSTEVWALNDSFTAIRDIKMCGCPAGFVHGLALPIAPVRGVEDPKRPDGIWQFAWDTATQRMEPESIALVVNPQFQRSQNQLHVHLLRLAADVRGRLDKEITANVSDLSQVWDSAARSAASKGLGDYGVLVVRRPQLDYQVVVMAGSPEAAFTQWRCD
ncbi:MAG: CDP-diacylglycerol diphosphatase [Rhodoferax sp.]